MKCLEYNEPKGVSMETTYTRDKTVIRVDGDNGLALYSK